MKMSLDEAIQHYALPFKTDDDLTHIVEAVGNAKIVLLGEASHGTSEFYTVRTALTKKLVEEKDFSLIAVEGDWPSARKVNRYIKGYEDSKTAPGEILSQAFERWPTWMWANEEVAQLIQSLKQLNDARRPKEKVGFYGFDLYSLWESMEEVVHYLEQAAPSNEELQLARNVLNCFEAFNRMPEHYAISTAHFPETCTNEANKLASSIRAHINHYPSDFEQDLNLKMNALVTRNAEAYYRISALSNSESWNVRDEHMVETIQELKSYFGERSKVIIWAHNTHIGDARATSMKDEGMVNVGQLLREHYEDGEVFAVGFGTFKGSVIAADQWGNSFEKMEVPPAQQDSWENALHRTGAHNKILLFTDENRQHFGTIDHRAIGVVYNPKYEAYGNYVPSDIAARYDAFVHIDETNAVRPIQRQ